ncbi:MAG: chemotaxis protein CheX [Pseudomonadota bacterium]
MSEEMMKAMKKAISEVMDKMFFMPVQVNEKSEALSDWFTCEEPIVGATLDFTGPQMGVSYILIPAGFAKEISANFLGSSEDSISDKQEQDTLKEALNMIVGFMFSQLKNGFKIGIPQYINESDFIARHFEGGYNGSFSIETNNNYIAAGLIINTP